MFHAVPDTTLHPGAQPADAIGVMIVDDHPMICEGIAAMIGNEAGIAVVAQAIDGHDALEQFRRHQPDVTLMDLQMPRMSGIDAIIAIRREYPDARIVVLSAYRGDVNISRAMSAGAAGYVLKSLLRKNLLETIYRVHQGARLIEGEIRDELDRYHRLDAISPREVQVLQLVARGHTNRAVAAQMSIKEETVKTHMRAITAKLGVNDRTHAVTIALRRGIIGL